MAVTSKIVTYEEWLQMPVVEDCIEEVVNGEIRIMPPDKSLHARVLRSLRHQLESNLDPDTVLLLTETFGLVIRRQPLTSRVPDLAVFIEANVVEIDGYFHSAPELLVEVLSPGNTTAEIAEKLRDYESIGAPELWLISPAEKYVEVLLLENGRFQSAGIFREGRLAPRQFPQAVIDIAAIWEK